MGLSFHAGAPASWRSFSRHLSCFTDQMSAWSGRAHQTHPQATARVLPSPEEHLKCFPLCTTSTWFRLACDHQHDSCTSSALQCAPILFYFMLYYFCPPLCSLVSWCTTILMKDYTNQPNTNAIEIHWQHLTYVHCRSSGSLGTGRST